MSFQLSLLKIQYSYRHRGSLTLCQYDIPEFNIRLRVYWSIHRALKMLCGPGFLPVGLSLDTPAPYLYFLPPRPPPSLVPFSPSLVPLRSSLLILMPSTYSAVMAAAQQFSSRLGGRFSTLRLFCLTPPSLCLSLSPSLLHSLHF